MTTQPDARTTAPIRSLRRFVALMQRRPLWVLGAALVIGAALARYTATHLTVDTNLENMLSPELPWRLAQQRTARLFPDLNEGLVAVIDADSPDLADDAERRLVESLRAQPDRFAEVYASETDPYFRRNGLLYLSTADLQTLADRLDQAQPFLGTLVQDPSLHGLFTLLDRAVTSPEAAGFDLSPAFGGIATTVDAAAAGRFHPLSWQSLIGAGAGPRQGDAMRRFIEIEPKLDYSRLFPAEESIAAFRTTVEHLDLTRARGVTVRLSGSKAMEHEELKQAFGGGIKSFVAGLAMVVTLLYLALRSFKLVLAAVVTLLYGLLLTAGFAAVAIGHLNLISIAFSVLYIGLGIDYALYLCMQYRERLGDELPQAETLSSAAAEVGGFMAICAATTSIGFFAFVPTPFTGIAELGVISGVGMFISLAVSLSLLPALISLFPPAADKARLRPLGGWLSRALDWPYRYARSIWLGAALLAVGAIALVPRAYFDYNPIDLRDPKSESVATFRDLLRDPNIPTLTMSVLVPDADQARAVSAKLRGLSEVRRAISVLDLIPADQDAKLAIIGDLEVSLGTTLRGNGTRVEPVARPDDYGAIRQLAADLPGYIAQSGGTAAADAARTLATALEALDRETKAGDRDAVLARLRTGLLAALPAQIASLRDALDAGPVTQQDLPPEITRRWIGHDATGRTWYRVEIWPKRVMDDRAAMESFVAQVRAAAPEATGDALAYIESGRAVVGAFRQAFLYSAIAITALLVVLLRRLVDILVVLIPLALAGLLTVAGSVLLGVPFNFANVIALPLILGVGVDYGVYLAQRSRLAGSARTNILKTGSARAVLFGALITTANFGDLMLAKHPGIVSMGVLLTVGLSMTLLCALVLLPSLASRLFWTPRGR